MSDTTNYSNWVLTPKFLEIETLVTQNEEKIEWYKMYTSSDIFQVENLATLTDASLRSLRIKQTAPVSDVRISKNTVTVTGFVESGTNTSDYLVKTIFLTAKYGGTEFLAASCVAGSHPMLMPRNTTDQYTTFTIKAQIVLTNLESVSTRIEPIAPVSSERFERELAEAKRYSWVVFADSRTGENLSTTPLNKTFIGFAFDKKSQTPDLSDASHYVFVPLTDEDMQRAIGLLQQQQVNTNQKVSDLFVTMETKASQIQLAEQSKRITALQLDYQGMLSETQVRNLPQFREQIMRKLTDIDSVLSQVNQFLDFGTDVVLGNASGNMKIRVTDNSILLESGGRIVGEITHQSFRFSNGFITTRVQIGNHVLEDAGGTNTIIKYVGGQ